MTRPSGRLPRFATLFAGLVLVAAACTPAASTAPSTAPQSQGAASQAPASAAPGAVYPATAIDCANRPAGYTGEFSHIKAVDASTVEFDLCAPDVAFLAKLAFATNGIQDSAWLDKHAPDKSYVNLMNGTGPYMFKERVPGQTTTYTANPNYWGKDKPIAQTLIIREGPDTAEKRLQDLQAGPESADGIDNPAPDDYDTIKNDPNLQLINRDAFTILYLGFNVDDPPWDNEKVRQAIAEGIDKQAILDKFAPPGSSVADYFTPCSVPGGCEGDKWYAFDKAKAISDLKAANFDFSKTYDLYLRPKVRTYFPNPPATAVEIQAQLDALGVKVKIHTEDNDTYITNANKGQYSMFLLGWGGDYPDMTDFLDYHFGTGAQKSFGTHFKDIEDLLTKGATTLDPSARLGIYKDANNLVRQHVPMIPLTHTASASAWQKDVTGAQASPLGNDAFWVVKPGDRQQLIFEQNGKTSGLYCGDESDGDSLRNCEQVYDTLYTYKIGGTDVIPNLATSCDANSAGTVWTCKLQTGVKFHDGADFDASDVVASFAAQWDTKHPNHKGNGGTFEYWGGLWGGFLNPTPAK
jgi:peptide/nickel transport system substrate-binding protein